MWFDGELASLAGSGRAGFSIETGIGEADGVVDISGSVSRDDTAPRISGRMKSTADNAALFGEAIYGLAGLEGTPPLPVAPLSLETEFSANEFQADLSDLRFRLGDTAGGGNIRADFSEGSDISIELALSRLDLNAFGVSESGDSSASLHIPNDLTAAIDLSVDTATIRQAVLRQIVVSAGVSEGQVQVDQLSLQLPGGSDLSLAGALVSADGSPEFRGQIKTVSNNLRALLTSFDVDMAQVPEGQLAGFSLQGQARATADVIQVYGAAGQLDGSNFEGGVTLSLADRAAFGMDVKVDRLNLDRYLPEQEPEPSAGSQTPADQLRQTVVALADIDSNFKVQVDRLTLLGASARNTVLDARVLNGDLLVKQARLTGYRGSDISLNGEIINGESEPRLSLALQITSANIVPTLDWLEVPAEGPLSRLGALNISGELTGTLARQSLEFSGNTAGGSFELSGTVDALGEELRDIDLKLNVEHPSHQQFAAVLGIDLQGQVKDEPIEATFQLSGVEEGFDYAIDGNLFGGVVDIDARYQESETGWVLRGSGRARHDEFGDFANALGVDLNGTDVPVGALDIFSSFEGSEAAFSLSEIAATFGPVAIEGTLTATNLKAKPKVSARLRAGDVALDAFMAEDRTGIEEAQQAGGARWSRRSLGLESLNDFDADIELVAQRIAIWEYEFTKPVLKATIANGIATLETLEGGLFGGSVSMTGSINAAATPKLEVNIQLADARLEQLVATTAGIRPATGVFSFDGRFDAKGASQYEMISSLAGGGEATSRDGLLYRIDLPGFARNVAQSLRDLKGGGLGGVLGLVGGLKGRLSEGRTPYDRIDATIVATDGVLNFEMREVDIEATEVREADVQAVVNLPNWEMDVTVPMRVAADPTVPPVTLRLQGPIHSPRKRIGAEAITGFLREQAASGGLKNLLGGGQRDVPEAEVGSDQPVQDSEFEPEAAPESIGEQLLRGLLDRKRKKDN